MNGNDIIKLGYPVGPMIGQALRVLAEFKLEYPEWFNKQDFEDDCTELLKTIREDYHFLSTSSKEDADVKKLAQMWKEYLDGPTIPLEETLSEHVPLYPVFDEGVTIQKEAIEQMNVAARLIHVTAGCALLPDAHLGYGIPIGGVWATKNVISPNAVGSDIACQVNASFYDTLASDYTKEELKDALMECTRFKLDNFRRDMSGAPIFYDPAWEEVEFLAKNPQVKEMAIKQYCTSGDGNHFANFGYVWQDEEAKDGPLALVTHWGSRSLGSRIAKHFHELALKERKNLPKEAQGLAWLDTESELGKQYIMAMQLAEKYATIGHDWVHDVIGLELNTDTYYRVHSVHNLATLENGAWVHRKGATPASKNEPGVIPGSMVHDIAIVRGKGNSLSWNSASHGSGREMSRGVAKRTLSAAEMQRLLSINGVELIGGGLDESPDAYKSIHKVLKAQEECVEVECYIKPQVVRMAS